MNDYIDKEYYYSTDDGNVMRHLKNGRELQKPKSNYSKNELDNLELYIRRKISRNDLLPSVRHKIKKEKVYWDKVLDQLHIQDRASWYQKWSEQILRWYGR